MLVVLEDCGDLGGGVLVFPPEPDVLILAQRRSSLEYRDSALSNPTMQFPMYVRPPPYFYTFTQIHIIHHHMQLTSSSTL